VGHSVIRKARSNQNAKKHAERLLQKEKPDRGGGLRAGDFRVRLGVSGRTGGTPAEHPKKRRKEERKRKIKIAGGEEK